MTKDPLRCDDRAAKALVREFIPDAKTIANVSGELAMSLGSDYEDR